jgi:hypothetical protein
MVNKARALSWPLELRLAVFAEITAEKIFKLLIAAEGIMT